MAALATTTTQDPGIDSMSIDQLTRFVVQATKDVAKEPQAGGVMNFKLISTLYDIQDRLRNTKEILIGFFRFDIVEQDIKTLLKYINSQLSSLMATNVNGSKSSGISTLSKVAADIQEVVKDLNQLDYKELQQRAVRTQQAEMWSSIKDDPIQRHPSHHSLHSGKAQSQPPAAPQQPLSQQYTSPMKQVLQSKIVQVYIQQNI